MVIPVAVAAADNSAIVGVWKGKMDSLPMLTLTVEEVGKGIPDIIERWRDTFGS